MALSEQELTSRKQEFRDFVWNHADDIFQKKFDLCQSLSGNEKKLLLALLSNKNLANESLLAEAVRSLVVKIPSLLPRLLQIVGLTRNKIIQDIKAHARHHKLAIPLSNPDALFRGEAGGRLAGAYLARHLIRVFSGARGHISGELLEVLNQATWLGYIRQERAKKSGHEAENRLALLLQACGISFAPDKANNPLGKDIQVDRISYDLVSPSVDNARMRVLSMAHSSNIGQYGEEKAKSVEEARKALRKQGAGNNVVLLALVDGVGFESNSAGLTGVLKSADEFCQFRTIWKAGVIAAKVSAMNCKVALPAEMHERFKPFCKKYGATLIGLNKVDGTKEWVAAGDGFLRVTR